MKRKTIKKILSHVFNNWVASIDEHDKELAEECRKGTIITGGSIVSMLQNENVNDYDLYFLEVAIAGILKTKWNSFRTH